MGRLTPLQKLVTAPAALRLSFALSEALNRLASGPTARRRERNRAAVEKFRCAGPLNGQRRAPVAALPYGRYTMDYNGCEVLAAYNALVLLGEPVPLAEVSAWFERRGIFLGGAWGTHVLALPEFFAARGVRAGTVYENFDAAFARAPAAVFAFWNDAKRLRRGLHTVALGHTPEGGPAIYNLRGLDPAANREYPSLAAFVAASGALPVLMVTCSSPE